MYVLITCHCKCYPMNTRGFMLLPTYSVSLPACVPHTDEHLCHAPVWSSASWLSRAAHAQALHSKGWAADTSTGQWVKEKRALQFIPLKYTSKIVGSALISFRTSPSVLTLRCCCVRTYVCTVCTYYVCISEQLLYICTYVLSQRVLTQLHVGNLNISNLTTVLHE